MLPISATAAGLGKLNISSGIGEPLVANIELLSVSASELSTVEASMAPADTYSSQGLERPASHSDIKVTVGKNSNGKPILNLRSNSPITEPFLDMLIQLDWESGRLLREYTVLLDPPGYKPPAVVPLSQATIVKEMAVKPETIKPVTKAQKTTNSNSAEKEPETVSQEVNQSLDKEYLTEKGDTLSKIALQVRPEGVSLDQMLVSLYETNKKAFSGDNMHRLNVGKIIRIPSAADIKALSKKSASREVKVQTDNWNAYRNKLAGIVDESAVVESEGDSQVTSGAIKPATEDKSITTDEPKDVVKLSTGEDANSVDAKSMQSKISALQEEITAREKGLAEAQDRTSALEQQVADLQKLIALKNNTMAEVQDEVQNSIDTVEETKPINENGSAEEIKSMEADVNSVEAAKSAAAVASEQVAIDESTTQIKPEITKPVKSTEKPNPGNVSTPVEQPSFIQSMMTGLDATMLAAGAGIIALLALGWAILRHRRKKNLDDFEQGIMTSGGLKANTVFGNTSGASVDTGDTSFLTDFSQSAHGGMIDTQDVDPIAEAEVYMAYGRDAQAEEILKDAISKEPKRYELHLKLLEMYAASKNMSAFETVSGELYTTLGADDPTWAKVVAVGNKLEPNNPLYQVSEVDASSEANADDEKESLDVSDFSDIPLADETDLNFSFEGEQNKSENQTDEPGKLGEDDSESALDFIVEQDKEGGLTDTQTIPMGLQASGIAEVETVEGLPESLDMTSLDINPDEIVGDEVGKDTSNNFDFDVSKLNAETLEETGHITESIELSEEQVNFEHTMPSLEFPETKDINAEPELSDQVEIADNDVFVMSEDVLSIDMPDNVELEPEEQVEVEANADEGFDFNLSADTKDNEAAAAVLDLSGISLETDDIDFNEVISLDGNSEAVVDDEKNVVAAENIESITISDDEPEEVETKLELIAAYIDMEDKEGAKELLDEVIKEGGASQKKRAEDLLTQLG